MYRERRTRVTSSDATEILLKPVEIRALRARVEMLLERPTRSFRLSEA